MIGQVQTAYLDKGKDDSRSHHAEPTAVLRRRRTCETRCRVGLLESGTPTKEHAYAVIFGVERYRDLPQVDYATRDAMVKKYLVKTLGYREQNIVML